MNSGNRSVRAFRGFLQRCMPALAYVVLSTPQFLVSSNQHGHSGVHQAWSDEETSPPFPASIYAYPSRGRAFVAQRRQLFDRLICWSFRPRVTTSIYQLSQDLKCENLAHSISCATNLNLFLMQIVSHNISTPWEIHGAFIIVGTFFEIIGATIF